jgi:hypothetical protein
MGYVVLISLIIAGCAHPRADEWWPKDHYQMMKECRAMCANRVESYTLIDGQCVCYKRR